MRKVRIFSGSSHPALTASICERLGTQPAKCDLGKFSNGETSISIGTSIRDQDVFIVQSGSKKINDSVIELLIMISACKGSSARSITAVMPYFPYSRQSKKKSHRGAITARMITNLLSVAGVNHVITVDLHASPMQGFFGQPVDNLHAEPSIARWIRKNVTDWQEAVVVSKNPGGSKRVTSLADVLKLNFGIITTDRLRSPMNGSAVMDTQTLYSPGVEDEEEISNSLATEVGKISVIGGGTDEATAAKNPAHSGASSSFQSPANAVSQSAQPILRPSPLTGMSTLATPLRLNNDSPSPSTSRTRLIRSHTAPTTPLKSSELEEEYTDERAREVITGRFYQGHIVDDDFPSPMLSTMSGSIANLPEQHLGPSHIDERDPMTSSVMSTVSSLHQGEGMGGSYDAAAMSDEGEENLKNPELEHTITLVGNVNGRTVFIIDDMIDRAESWIAAAETVVKRGGAKQVYCIATHGVFGGESLEELESCECIDYIVVSNTFPIESERAKASRKLIVLDLSGLLAEAIRRNHYGESISILYQQYQD